MKKQVDLYDFDKTLIPFDSGSLFVLYCMAHYPWCIIILPAVAVCGLLMLLGIIDFTAFKKTCFMFLPLIPKEKAVKRFWDKHISQIYPWFKERNREEIVISASPDFLLKEMQKRLGIKNLICTRHNPKTGVIIGKNCRDEEKVRRLFEQFDKDSIQIVDVYSDSIKHDIPIFKLATGQCYHIVNGERIPFEINDYTKV